MTTRIPAIIRTVRAAVSAAAESLAQSATSPMPRGADAFPGLPRFGRPLAGKETSRPPRAALPSLASDTGAGGDSGGAPWGLGRIAKGAILAASAAYVGDKVGNDFFLSVTSPFDGKGGFTSNKRLDDARVEAREHLQRYRDATPDELASGSRPPRGATRVGSNQFLTMVDYRAASKSYLEDSVNTQEARRSLETSLACFMGQRVKPECVAEHRPSHVPADFDLTRSPMFKEKNKYALAGIPNEKTGASGYVSRSPSQPFVNQGMQHYRDELGRRGRSSADHLAAFGTAAGRTAKLEPDAQRAAGQLVLNLRQVYADDQHWGHAEKVVMPALRAMGLLSQDEADKLDASLLFEDPSKNPLKRNTSLMGPPLHKLDTGIQTFLHRHDQEARENFQSMGGQKNMENLPISHFKLNEQGDGFEDCSGLGDSFTCANAAACINHSRIMSGEPPLSKHDVTVLVACLNAVYDDASSERHTLHEIARGCFVGAGYTNKDADQFYEALCLRSSEQFYVGKSLASAAQA